MFQYVLRRFLIAVPMLLGWAHEDGKSEDFTRRQMIERVRLFDTPGFRWIPARRRIEVDYRAVLKSAKRVPESL